MISSATHDPQRGDIVIIANRSAEFAGKPRPAVVLQSPLFQLSTLTICLVTSIAVEAPLLRVALPANEQTGLVSPSWAMIDQLTTVRRVRAERRIGHLDDAKMLEISQAVLVFLGIANGRQSGTGPSAMTLSRSR
ncbi:MAG: type II toxin-antitoxin system PemK/MazF family toxin [Alphaproteobacteria bacterium]|nr:type II toxin-antitoxin system PemK/MazF family toxin [Alphaproteobacteria bacterium]